jgi:hypothetical protein
MIVGTIIYDVITITCDIGTIKYDILKVPYQYIYIYIYIYIYCRITLLIKRNYFILLTILDVKLIITLL